MYEGRTWAERATQLGGIEILRVQLRVQAQQIFMPSKPSLGTARTAHSATPSTALSAVSISPSSMR